MPGTRKLGKPTDQRMAMLRAMTTALLEHGQIKTTVSRAKEVAPLAERMITLGKKQTLASYRQALSFLTRSHPSITTATAVIPASSASVSAAATALRWRSSNWCKSREKSEKKTQEWIRFCFCVFFLRRRKASQSSRRAAFSNRKPAKRFRFDAFAKSI